MENNFEKELEQLINKYSVESESNTPDFILAEYLSNCLNTFNIAIQRREDWYGRNKPSAIDMNVVFESEAIMLEKAASTHNYHNYCAKRTLGVRPAITPYQLLRDDYGRIRSKLEKEAITEILKQRNTCCDLFNNAYDDWEITIVRMNGCPCGHNGKTLPSDYRNSSILKVRVGDKHYEIRDKVRNDGIIENFTLDNCGRVIATVDYKHICPFKHYTKFIDIVNL